MVTSIRTSMTVVAAVVAVALVGCTSRTGPAAASSPSSEKLVTTTTTYQHMPYIPQPTDFTLEVQVIEQKCFGSAGCNVTFRVGVTYDGELIYEGEGPYTVVYSVVGTDDPFVGRFTLLSQYNYSATEEFVSTPPGATLTASVTQVF
jgi:hypothetical protein